jgi:hypothetical protein
MKKICAVLLASVLFATAATAEKVAYACQFTIANGLDWKGHNWVKQSFNVPKPFVLVVEDNVITDDSAEKVFSSPKSQILCGTLVQPSCISLTGESLMFNPKLGEGALSQILGGALPEDPKLGRDSLAVMAFTCSKF